MRSERKTMVLVTERYNIDLIKILSLDNQEETKSIRLKSTWSKLYDGHNWFVQDKLRIDSNGTI